MPGLIAFGRRWRIGADDLALPGMILAMLHLFLAVILGVLLVLVEWDRSYECISYLWDYSIVYLAIFITVMAVEFGMCLLATRGSILDTTARAPMQHLLYIRLLLMFVEGSWLAVGVIWLKHYYQICPVDQGKDLMLALVISNSCVLVTIVVTVWCVYDAAGRSWVKMKKYQRSMKEAETKGSGRIQKRSGSRNRNWRQRKVIRAYQNSWDSRCRLLFCCIGKSDRNRNSFTDIAKLLSEFFRDLDVVPSDVVAGLVLLRKFQKIERELIVKQRKNDTYEFLSGVPVTSRTKFLSLTEEGDLEQFQNAIHYMHFALAAYGWPLYLVNHSNGLCHLCARLRCCCFPCGSRDDDAVIIEDNCCRCNYAALRRMVEIGEVEVMYATFHVDVGETPFFVALDHTKKRIVISIRGTLSMKDVMTDLNAESEVIPLTPPREDWLGHKGMVQAAEYIKKRLREENIITKALEKYPERGTRSYNLQLVGHSLGAGTAAILAILLKQEYPDVLCFAFAPPGGLLSMPAQEYTQEFITSVVVGKDVVPRIGLRQMESLRADLINAIKRSVDPKWKTITCSVMCCGCGTIPTSAANLEAGGCISEYQREKDLARSQAQVPADSNVALTLHRPLYPPGRIIHVVRHHASQTEHKYASTWRNLLAKHEPVYQALWAGPCDFDEVLISPVMIQDHMPDNMLKALNKVITTQGPVKPQRVISGPISTIPNCQSENHVVNGLNRGTPGMVSSPPTLQRPTKMVLLTAETAVTGPGTGPARRKRLYFETSFTSLQSPLWSDECGRELSVDSRGLPWEYVSTSEAMTPSSPRNGYLLSGRSPYRGPDWSMYSRVAPLATPETLSEASTSSPPSPLPNFRPVRRPPKIPGTVSFTSQELRNALKSKNYNLHELFVMKGSSSGGNSESVSFECSSRGPPPPVPRRRDSVHIFVEPQKICSAPCCTDRNESENSSPQTSSQSSSRFSRIRHQVQIDFSENDHMKNGLNEPMSSGADENASFGVLSSFRSSPESKVVLMAPATDLGAEWRRRLDSSNDASLPLLRGLATSSGANGSPFFNAKRKKYVYPITLVGRGESSV